MLTLADLLISRCTVEAPDRDKLRLALKIIMQFRKKHFDFYQSLLHIVGFTIMEFPLHTSFAFCSECGTALPPDSKFCGNCGGRLSLE